MKTELTREKIMKIMNGSWSFKALYAAVYLEIFTKISQGKNTAELISKELKTKEDGIERLLNACAALNLLIKNNQAYQNIPEAEQFLVKGKESYYGDMIRMSGLGDSLKDVEKIILDPSLKKQNLKSRMKNSEQAEIFTKAMHNNAMGPAKILSNKFDFSNFKKLLDLGGGSGAFSIVLTKKYENLNAIVFDLPNVCKVTEKFIKETKAEKVRTIEGDFFKDELPKDCTIVLISQILHSFNAEKNKEILEKVYNSLPEEGIVIINEFLLNPEKTGPLFPALFALNMFAGSEEGNAYTEEEIKGWLEDIGFKYEQTLHLAGPIKSIIARK